MKENCQLHSDSRRKVEILNNQFCSVFTLEDITNIGLPELPGPPNTEMPIFEITVQGVTKLLEGLNGRKASGPAGRAPKLDSEECCQQKISLS